MCHTVSSASYDDQAWRDILVDRLNRLDSMGPGDGKLQCGPTTRIEGKEKCNRKGVEKARKAQS